MNVNINALVSSIIKYMQEDKKENIVYLLGNASFSFEEIGYDNWNGGVYLYSLNLSVDISIYRKYQLFISDFQREIYQVAALFIDNSSGEQLSDVSIKPACRHYLNWDILNGKCNQESLLALIEQIKVLMISVSTGGPKIQAVDEQYKIMYKQLSEYLTLLRLDNPNPYKSLWEWYDRWSKPDLSTYKGRRIFVSNLYDDLDNQITTSEKTTGELFEPTGWDRVDRTIYEMKSRMLVAENEEHYQAIGMLGREALISVAQIVFDNKLHYTEGGLIPSDTDSKRMLDAFLSFELGGDSNERTRKFAKSAIDMANNLTHKRTATSREASMCIVSVSAVASLSKIIDDSKTEF